MICSPHGGIVAAVCGLDLGLERVGKGSARTSALGFAGGFQQSITGLCSSKNSGSQSDISPAEGTGFAKPASETLPERGLLFH